MTRKFLFCFPLRVGNLVFGYLLITLSIIVVVYNLFHLALTFVSNYEELERERKFGNFEHLETIFGQSKQDLVTLVTMLYYASYVVVGFLLFLFSSFFVCGAYKVNSCLVSTFFVYSFIHLFLTIGLIVWEATTGGWIQLGLIVGFDVVLLVCLFSVKYLIEAIKTGHIYSRPGDEYYKY